MKRDLLEDETKIEITCKYCGCCDSANICEGKGPHAYELKCRHCGKHARWASALDVEGFDMGDVAQKISDHEWAAIRAAKSGDIKEYYKEISARDRYAERL